MKVAAPLKNMNPMAVAVCSNRQAVRVLAGQPVGAVKEQFSTRAQAMSVRMHQMANRIGELTRLARQTTMFEDNSTQINHLTAQVKTGLQSLVCFLLFNKDNRPTSILLAWFCQ
jgi:hypothetical protein